LLRQDIANTGWPDGFELTIATVYAPGAVQVADQLHRVGIATQILALEEARIDTLLATGQIHLVLFTWATPENRERWIARVSEVNILDLYTVPINYLASPTLTITFTSNGWPLPSR
jgi:hypothetical protein